MSSRTRSPERDSDFTWEEPYSGGGGSGRRRRSTAGERKPAARKPRGGGGGNGPRMVALPVVVVALVIGLLIGFLVGGGGGTSTVTETATVTTSAEASAPAASGPESRPDINVAVLNGSDQDGLAARTGDRLRDLGYVQVSEGNAPSRVPADRILYRPGAEAQAAQVAQDLGAGAPIALPQGGAIAQAAPDAAVIAVMGPQAGAPGAGDAGDAGGAGDAGDTSSIPPADATVDGSATP